MKSFRWTLFFGVVIAALLAFTIWDQKRADRVEQVKDASSRIVKVTPEEAKRIEFVRRNETIVLEKNDGVWRIVRPIDELADQQAIIGLLSSLSDEKIVDTVVEGSEFDPKPFGLDDPPTRLVLEGAGKRDDVKIGSIKAFDNRLYAQLGDEKRVVSVENSWDMHLTKTVRQLQSKSLFIVAGKPEETKRIEIIRTSAGRKVEIALSNEKDGWKFVKGGSDYPVSDSAVRAYVDRLKALRGNDLVDGDKSVAATLKNYGLDRPRLTVRLFASESRPFYEVHFADLKATDPSSADPGSVAVSTDVRPIVKVHTGLVDSLAARDQNFYDKSLPFKFSTSKIERIDVEAAGKRARFVKSGAGWKAEDPGLQKSLDGAKLDELLVKLGRLEALRILEPLKTIENGLSTIKSPSKVVLSAANGEKVFEFEWGAEITRADRDGDPEMRFYPARTDKTDRLIGVAEGAVEALALPSLLVPPEKGKGEDVRNSGEVSDEG